MHDPYSCPHIFTTRLSLALISLSEKEKLTTDQQQTSESLTCCKYDSHGGILPIGKITREGTTIRYFYSIH